MFSFFTFAVTDEEVHNALFVFALLKVRFVVYPCKDHLGMSVECMHRRLPQ